MKPTPRKSTSPIAPATKTPARKPEPAPAAPTPPPKPTPVVKAAAAPPAPVKPATPAPTVAKPAAPLPAAPKSSVPAPVKAAKVSTPPSTKPSSTGRKVVFKLSAPTAREVFVAGSFNGWRVGATPLRPASAGSWQGDLPLPPGRYEYQFVVDGAWKTDPAAPETVTNPYGGRNSVLCVD